MNLGVGLKSTGTRYSLYPVPNKRPNPWLYLKDNHPDIPVWVTANLGSRWGQTVWHDDGRVSIHLAFDLGERQMRCALAHEIHHLLRGAPCHSLCPLDEWEVRAATARWLLPDLDLFADTLARMDLGRAVEHLQVTGCVLMDRLYGLTSDEIAHVGVRLNGKDTTLTAPPWLTTLGPHRFPSTTICQRNTTRE